METQGKNFTFASHIGIIIFFIFTFVSIYGIIFYLNVNYRVYWGLNICTASIFFIIIALYYEEEKLLKTIKYCDKGLILPETHEFLSWDNLVWCNISYVLDKISILKLKFLDREKIIELSTSNELQLIYDLIVASKKDFLAPDTNNTLEWQKPENFIDTSRKTIKNYLSPLTVFIAILIILLIFMIIYILLTNLGDAKSNDMDNRISMAVIFTVFITFFGLLILGAIVCDPLYTKFAINPAGIFMICDDAKRRLLLWQNISSIQYTKNDENINVIEVKCSNYETFNIPINTNEVKLSEIHKLMDIYHNGTLQDINYDTFDELEKKLSIPSETPEILTPCTLSLTGKFSPYKIIGGVILFTVMLMLKVLAKDDFSRIPYTLHKWLLLIGISGFLPVIIGTSILWKQIKLLSRLKEIQYSKYGIKANNDAPLCKWSDLIGINKDHMNNVIHLLFNNGQIIILSNDLAEKDIIYNLALYYSKSPIMIQNTRIQDNELKIPGTISWKTPFKYKCRKLPEECKNILIAFFKYLGSSTGLGLIFIIELLIYGYAKLIHFINPKQSFLDAFHETNFKLFIIILAFSFLFMLISLISKLTQELIVLKKNAIIISDDNSRKEIKYDRINAYELISDDIFQILELRVEGIEGKPEKVKIVLPIENDLSSQILERLYMEGH